MNDTIQLTDLAGDTVRLPWSEIQSDPSYLALQVRDLRQLACSDQEIMGHTRFSDEDLVTVVVRVPQEHRRVIMSLQELTRPMCDLRSPRSLS